MVWEDGEGDLASYPIFLHYFLGYINLAVPHRKFLTLPEENRFDAVIGLPEKLFFGTGISAAILVFRKRKADG